ncbi:glycosyltransferase [Calothrix sp. PCC 7507]|uniref:glycosyltransferase n=1 Tax=Calothrix sp. PCC 7507 TaxID=99598 RepID=UPI00029F31D2|nr:glycosyltransferase [Calothrix sp. PCC 7507]AFY30867.1 glycosyl transferase group 1 [Calothrix sp. PCC 7507]
MKVLVALPITHPKVNSVDHVLHGIEAVSGTVGSIMRVASFLANAGLDVYLSLSSEGQSSKFLCIQHEKAKLEQFDWLIVHQSHWNSLELTFGNHVLSKTFLWLHNQTSWKFIHDFINSGGYRVIAPSGYQANIYRAINGWQEKIKFIYNPYCAVFVPKKAQVQHQLLFVGAITPSKGFVELMQIWSYIVQKQVNLQLAIAGGINIHKGADIKLGAMGIAESDFETKQIQPWLKTLPEKYQPQFLGALPPQELHKTICESWAVIVNPSWSSPETFCCSAVEAQACDRTVFGIAAGGLKETVYQGQLKTLTNGKSPEALGDLILHGLSHMEAVAENGKLAGEFARSKFNQQSISDAWIQSLSGKPIDSSILSTWDTPKDLAFDFLRWTGTGMAIKSAYGKLLNRP